MAAWPGMTSNWSVLTSRPTFHWQVGEEPLLLVLRSMKGPFGLPQEKVLPPASMAADPERFE